MKTCEKCGNVYSDEILECPYCNREEQNSITDAAEAEQKPETDKCFCKYCGTEIVKGNDFCTHCGRSIEKKGVKHCVQCGQILTEGQQFCDKCGQKVAFAVLPKSVEKIKRKLNKKLIIVLLAALVAVAGLAVVAVNVIPKLFVSPEDYLVQGNYEKAYEKAKKEKKDLVFRENIVAAVSRDAKENLKDANSFVLREAYVTDDALNVVLGVQGANSFGGTVTSWCVYTYEKEDKKFILWNNITDFEKEEDYSWDDSNEKFEKALQNLSKTLAKSIIEEEKNKLDSEVVDRINGLNKEGELSSVELMDVVKEKLDSIEDEEGNNS